MDPNNYWCLQENRDSFILVLIALSLWSIPWKALALWRSAQKNQKIWFIVFIIANTLAILEIFYLFILPKISKDERK